jgi:carbohydrate binding protein with CBM4/9 domain
VLPFLRARVGCYLPLALPLLGCSLQNFETLGGGNNALVVAGAAGVGNGSGGSAGASSTPGGASGTSAGGSDGVRGNGGSSVGGGAGGGAVTDADAGSASNLIPNSSFEAGHSGWVGFGSSAILDVEEQPHSGSYCIGSTHRNAAWEGPARRIESVVTGGARYAVDAWARSSEGSHVIGMSLKTVCEGEMEAYAPIAATAVGADWTPVGGEFTAPTCVLSELRVYFEGPPAGVDFFVDDVSMSPVD